MFANGSTHQSIAMNDDRIPTGCAMGGCAILVLYILALAAFWITVAFVLMHFILKLW